MSLYYVNALCGMYHCLAAGEGAFANWTYVIRWRALNVPSATEMSTNTSELTEVLGGLQPGSLYEISVLACGPSLVDVDCQVARDKLVFSTKSAGNLRSVMIQF